MNVWQALTGAGCLVAATMAVVELTRAVRYGEDDGITTDVARALIALIALLAGGFIAYLFFSAMPNGVSYLLGYGVLWLLGAAGLGRFAIVAVRYVRRRLGRDRSA